jgi:hypothetical protein
MGPKLLFVFGIVLAHGALAAGWMAQEGPRQREAVIASCSQMRGNPPHFSPPRELLAYVVTPASAPEMWQP